MTDNIFDLPSPWTPDQVFNRLCRTTERCVLQPMADRSVLVQARARDARLAGQLARAISEADALAASQNESVGELSKVMRQLLNETPVFFLDLDVLRRVAAFCSASPQDLMTDPFPRFPFDPVTLVNPYNAVLLFDPDDGTRDRYQWPEGVRWRCKFLAYYQEKGAWFSVMGAANLLDPDPVTLARCISPVDMWVSCARTEDGDGDWSGGFGRFAELRPEEGANLHKIIAQSLSMAFDVCRYIGQPRHHLVMETPRAWRPGSGQARPKIPRAADRPRIRIVEPEEVKRLYPHHRDSTGRTVTPHARRSHVKVLTHPRYKAAQGRRLVIRETWVGDPEWEHAGTRYKVVYRKGDEQK